MTAERLDDREWLVSVVMPVYNGEVFLKEAVENVLAQSCPPLEVIIIDDGSTDRTPELAAALGGDIRYVRRPHRGLPAARNEGVRLARGDVIGFLDVDDLWSVDKLALQLALLRNNPHAPIVLGHTQLMRLVGSEEGGILQFVNWGPPTLAMSMGSGLFRKAVFARVGLFDETQTYCDDLDWFMRAREQQVSSLVHPEVTLYYRRHTRNMTNEAELSKQSLIGMLKKSLDRRAQHGTPPSLR